MLRLIAAYRNSQRALVRAWRTEHAVREELVLLALALPLAFLITSSAWLRIALVGTVLLVLMVELLNTAVEKVCDRLHPAQDDLIGYVKDLGSAAVLMSLLLAASVWLTALWQWADAWL
jgi:diacylglycerol kinase (ATP)